MSSKGGKEARKWRGSRVYYLGRHLMVKGNYVNAILESKKVATIRLGIVKPKYNELIIHGGGRPVAKVAIESVEYKKVRELTDEDAKLDGFKTKDELIEELRRLYGYISSDDYVTIIKFKVIQKLTDLQPVDHYLGLQVGDVARLGLRYLSKELSNEDKEILIDLTRTNSIRKTAINIFGDLNKRRIVRRLLRKVLNELVRRGIISVSEEGGKE